MKQDSFEISARNHAIGWTTAGIFLTLSLCASLGVVLTFKDTERQVETFASSALASQRTEILSGDIRSTELRLKKEIGIREGETLLFLDSNKSPWVADLRPTKLENCPGERKICRSWIRQKIIADVPVFFDDEAKHLWGYLHIERNPQTNWSLVFSVLLAVIAGMLFLAFGFYFHQMRFVRAVSESMTGWAKNLAANPKNPSTYSVVPFAEIAPVGAALAGLKDEIDALERAAHQQGALTTLRGVGHDILNPVSRMKRILGVLEMEGTLDAPLLASMKANLKRLSSYAEQLKLIYKRQNGEPIEAAPILDISKEVRLLAQELLHDPETIEKRLNLQVSIGDGCRARIEAGTFREDLYYRLSSVILTTAPLRERPDDIEPLLVHFTDQICKENGFDRAFHRRCLDILREYHWKGNVRELRSVVESHLIACESGMVRVEELDARLYQKYQSDSPATLEEFDEHLDGLKKQFVVDVLKNTPSRAEAARKLDVAPNRLHYFITKWGLDARAE